MKFATLLTCLCVGYSGVASSQQHVHGQASVFIVQENNVWQVQYMLSASDALGFEHKPETLEQLATVAKLQTTIMDIKNMIGFDAKCTQSSYHSNLDVFSAEEEHHSNHHEGEHSSNQHEDEHEGEHDEEPHQNIEVRYSMQCIEDITVLSFPIFHKMHSLERLDVQWNIASGQGAAVVNNSDSQVKLR